MSVFHWQFLFTYILSASLKFEACYLHHGSMEQVQSKECNSKTTYAILGIFFFVVVFHQKICAFTIFISFSDKVFNLRNRILTNRKPELVIRNRHWNFMLLFLYDSFCCVFFLWFLSISRILSFWFLLSFWQTVFFIFTTFFLSSFPCLFLFLLSTMHYYLLLLFSLFILFLLSFCHLCNICMSYLGVLWMVSKHFYFFTRITSLRRNHCNRRFCKST